MYIYNCILKWPQALNTRKSNYSLHQFNDKNTTRPYDKENCPQSQNKESVLSSKTATALSDYRTPEMGLVQIEMFSTYLIQKRMQTH